MGRHKEFVKPLIMRWLSARKSKPCEGYVLIILRNETKIRSAYYHKDKGYCFENDLTYEPIPYADDIWKFFEVKNVPFPTFPVKDREDTQDEME